MSDARHTPASGFDWESAEDEDLTSLPGLLPGLDHGRSLWRVAGEERAAAFRREDLLGGEGGAG